MSICYNIKRQYMSYPNKEVINSSKFAILNSYMVKVRTFNNFCKRTLVVLAFKYQIDQYIQFLYIAGISSKIFIKEVINVLIFASISTFTYNFVCKGTYSRLRHDLRYQNWNCEDLKVTNRKMHTCSMHFQNSLVQRFILVPAPSLSTTESPSSL